MLIHSPYMLSHHLLEIRKKTEAKVGRNLFDLTCHPHMHKCVCAHCEFRFMCVFVEKCVFTIKLSTG